MYGCLSTFIFSNANDVWAILEYDEHAARGRGAHCPPSNQIPSPGIYVLLTPGTCLSPRIKSFADLCTLDGNPLSVGLTVLSARPRHPTISNRQTRVCSHRSCTDSMLKSSSHREKLPEYECMGETPVSLSLVFQYFRVTFLASSSCIFFHACMTSRSVFSILLYQRRNLSDSGESTMGIRA